MRTMDSDMTKDEYRQHMRKYSRDTMAMSFVVTNHPDYQALQAAGSEIVPYLLNDILDPDWHCNACYGFGYELAPEWQEEWDKTKAWPPRSTGNPCPECKGKGSINSHAAMSLLFKKTGDDAPKVENWMRGRHVALTKMWRKWGEQRGYLPASVPDYTSPRLYPAPDMLTRLGRAVLGLFKR